MLPNYLLAPCLVLPNYLPAPCLVLPNYLPAPRLVLPNLFEAATGFEPARVAQYRARGPAAPSGNLLAIVSAFRYAIGF